MEKKQFNEQYGPLIPSVAGVYRYYDKDKNLLYVGKAKDLKKRIFSYFSGQQTSKTEVLVSLIHHIEWTVTPSEHDAFLMENSLIKHFMPPYNIQLKDDKSYPYIVIKHEPFPRVFITRKRYKNGGHYIGPFTNVKHIRKLLEIIKKYIPLRSCNLNLDPKLIASGKYKVCLDYHIKKCKGPCEGLQTLEDYQEDIALIKQLLRGNLNALIKTLEKKRNEASSALAFELAHRLQMHIDDIKTYRNKSSYVSVGFYHLDVITAIDTPDVIYINYMMVEDGEVIQSDNLKIVKKLEETIEEVLAHILINYRQRFNSTATEIVSSHEFLLKESNVQLILPKAGNRKKFLDLSLKNAHYFQLKEEKALSLKHLKKATSVPHQILEIVQEKLELPKLPIRIECFDNSNLQGSSPVSAMVSFLEGVPNKKDYRYFHIKTVAGIDDYASMKEVIHRRYTRVINEDLPLPDLIIIDGGKGQLSAAMSSLELLGLHDQIPVIALAEREEVVFKAYKSQAIRLPYNSDALLFLRRVRNEVHDFVLRFHQKTRSKNSFQNELLSIPGVGEATATKLLKYFKSVKRIKQASLEQISEVVGKSRAENIVQYFDGQK